jgi:probable HAF family extracellular repeat protein
MVCAPERLPFHEHCRPEMEGTFMVARRSTYRVIILSALLTCIATTNMAAASPPAYHVTDLGTLGGTWSAGLAINASGQVAGNSVTTGDAATHAFVWTPTTPNGSSGTMRDLGTLGGTSSQGWGINSRGQVAGYSQRPGSAVQHAFLYDGTMHDLRPLDASTSYGWDINDSGQVVGYSDSGGAFLYSGGAMHDLGAQFGVWSHGVGINGSGQVSGVYQSTWASDSHAFLWTPTVPNGVSGSMHDLGTLAGASSSYGYDVNDSGHVVGWSMVEAGYSYHAFLYDGAMHDLGWLESGAGSTTAVDINNEGQIVGNSNWRAFLYSGNRMVDLNTLIDPLSAWELGLAWAINDAGQITGWGFRNGQQHAFLLTPVPEPTSLLMLVTVLPLFIRRNSRRAWPGTTATSGSCAWAAGTLKWVRSSRYRGTQPPAADLAAPLSAETSSHNTHRLVVRNAARRLTT